MLYDRLESYEVKLAVVANQVWTVMPDGYTQMVTINLTTRISPINLT